MSKKVKVLHVVGPSRGGMRTHLSNLIEVIDRSTFYIVVACPEDAAISACLERCRWKHEPFSVPEGLSHPRDAAKVIALARLIRRVEPEICHFHGFKAAALGRAAARVLERVRAFHRPGTDLAHSARGGYRPAVVYTVHNSVLARARGSPQGRLCAYLERALAPVTDRVITVSAALRDEYASIPGLGPHKVRHIPNGVALDRFGGGHQGGVSFPEAKAGARSALGCRTDAVLIGTAARLIPDKGVGVLVHALARLRRWGLRPMALIAGDGPARRDLEALAARLGVANQLRFLGFVEDMARFYAAIDVFVLPSLSEGMPLSLLEAMAAGVPVVATRTPGTEEVVAPGMGWLAAPGDDLGLAVCLKECLLHPWEADQMAACARAEVRQRFSIEGMVRATQEVYIEALSDRTRPLRDGPR
ncbi:MAG: glycosyltransferase [Firmicutes bacterium]|nr:glycosyltransferase [Bacillota bacterium]MDH7496541.1 glycosyltransferase [Bacillota bacterium]